MFLMLYALQLTHTRSIVSRDTWASLFLLYFDLRPGQRCHSRVMHHRVVTHSWAEVGWWSGTRWGNSHGALMDWCAGGEWPLGCMAVVSAWCRLDMGFQGSSGRSGGRWTVVWLSQEGGQVSCSYSWRRSYRRDVVGKATPAEGALGNPDGVWGPEKLLIRCSKESQHTTEWPPGPPVEHQENEKDTTLPDIRLGSKYCSFCSVSSSLSP